MSLRLRLALWYGGVTGSILLLLALLGYTLHARAQYDALDRALVGAVAHLVGVHQSDPAAEELRAMLASPILPHIGIRLYAPDGEILAASPNAALTPMVEPSAVIARPAPPAYDWLTAWLLPLRPPTPEAGAFGLLTDERGHRWRLYVLPVGGRFIVAEASLQEIDGSVATLRGLVPLLALAGAGLTLGAGLLVAGRALQPIRLLTDTAHTIAHSHALDQRVPVGARRDELGRLARTFNEMLANLEQAAQSQQRFVADASHELRTPLTVIQANLELLERAELSEGERREILAEVQQEADRLTRLVTDLLVLARADAGATLRRERVDLDAVLLDALRAARHLDPTARLRLTNFELVQVPGDRDRLLQLLLILLDNALTYTPPTGRITLALVRRAGAARLTVRDTGSGIAPTELPLVRQRFYRADPARRRHPGGTGLGLAIADWIVAQHGGTLTITSEVGRGTTVTVCLPLHEERPCEAIPTP